MSGIRTFTDEHIFGTDPRKRSFIQAWARDVSHEYFHFGGAIFNCLTLNFEAAGQDLKRAVDHLTGENLRQRDRSRSRSRSRSSSR